MAKEAPSRKRNRGHTAAPGYSSSPGMTHSPEAEVAALKRMEVVLHAGSCSFEFVTHITTVLSGYSEGGTIIQQPLEIKLLSRHNC